MAATFSDLSEHTGTLIALLGILLAICGALVASIYKIGLTLKTDILEMITKLDNRVGDVWEEIGKLRERQETLREALPKEYLRIDGPGYRALLEGIGRIEVHFEQFAKDCRDGKCGGKNGVR